MLIKGYLIAYKLAKPLILLLVHLLRIIGIAALRARFQFESRNQLQEVGLTDQVPADVAFEVSSEGELEQVLPVLMSFIDKKKRVELVFCSDSVEHKCLKLLEEHPLYLRIFRMPLVTERFFGESEVGRWLTAKTLIFCRYDFFPQLVEYFMRPGHKGILLNAIFPTSGVKRYFYQKLFKHFELVVAATPAQVERIGEGSDYNDEVYAYDFRIDQIISRFENWEEKKKSLEAWKQFEENWISRFKRKDRIILGSAWVEDLVLIQSSFFGEEIARGEKLGVLAAHDLSSESFESFAESSLLPIYKIDLNDTAQAVQAFEQWSERPGWIWPVNKGLLCELYLNFGHAHIGGGFGRSVHSLLEPFLAGCLVSCGPRVHRSTEYELIQSQYPERVCIFQQDAGASLEQRPFSEFHLPERTLFSYRLKDMEEIIASCVLGKGNF